MGGNITMADDTSIGISDSDERIEFDGAGDISFLGCNVGIGVSTMETFYGSTSALQVEGLTHSTGAISIFRDSNDVAGAWLMLGSSRGTALNSDTIVQDGDNFGAIAFIGADGGDRDPVGAKIYAQVDGTPGVNDMPGRLVFGTTPDGSIDTTERMRISSDGTQNQQANYIVNEQGRQDHVANTMPAPYYRFDGSNDYIKVLDHANIDMGTNDFTISVWAKIPSSHSAAAMLVGKGTSGANPTIYLYFNSDGIFLAGVEDSSGNSADSTADGGDWRDDKWHHFLCVFNYGGTMNRYVDGVPIGTNDSMSSVGSTDNSNDLFIGAWETGASYNISASFSSVKIFNLALSATEVKELYSGASVPFKYKGANQTAIITG
jgi:hypothetical protein